MANPTLKQTLEHVDAWIRSGAAARDVERLARETVRRAADRVPPEALTRLGEMLERLRPIAERAAAAAQAGAETMRRAAQTRGDAAAGGAAAAARGGSGGARARRAHAAVLRLALRRVVEPQRARLELSRLPPRRLLCARGRLCEQRTRGHEERDGVGLLVEGEWRGKGVPRG
jgi:hypothetical protein